MIAGRGGDVTINDRIKIVRDYIGYTQEEFGRGINIKSRAHISALESGARTVTDRIAADVCRAYGINRDWLEKGEGEMLSETEAEFIASAIADVGEIGPLDTEIVRLYLRLSSEHKAAFRLLIKDISKTYKL